MVYFALMRYRFYNIFLLLFFFFATQCKAQDSSFLHHLLQRISFYQNSNTTTQGNFPSYITNKLSSKVQQPDDNVFFAALINYILQQNKASLSAQDHLVTDSISQRTKALYPHFQNHSGRLTYNFWRTDTVVPFRYTKWIRLIKKNTSLPDDMDDTVLSLLAQEADSADAAKAHTIMQAYVNKNRKQQTIGKQYRHYRAYSVWYGKNFPPVFDVSVLCNVLTFVQRYHLAWTSADSASLVVILLAIKNGDYIKRPLSVSPYYGNTSVILYHFARLMENNRIPRLDSLKTELVITAAKQLQQADDLLEKVILSNALIKWGYKVPAISMSDEEQAIKGIESSPLSFFIGNIPSYFPPFYKQLFTQKKWLLFYHYCPVFNDTLLVEYLSLLQKNQR